MKTVPPRCTWQFSNQTSLAKGFGAVGVLLVMLAVGMGCCKQKKTENKSTEDRTASEACSEKVTHHCEPNNKYSPMCTDKNECETCCKSEGADRSMTSPGRDGCTCFKGSAAE
jgi:hypothetical protein